MSVIQNDDFIVGGGASTPADVIITAGGAVLAPGADQLTYVAGDAGTLRQATFAGGSLALQGSDAVLAYNRSFGVESGAFSLTGGLLEGQAFERTLQVDSGGFTLFGNPQDLELSRAIAPISGQLALTGSPAEIKSQKRIDLSPSSYTLTGSDIQLRKNNKITPQSGTFALLGNELGFIADKSIRPLSGVFALSGQQINFNRVAELGGEPGSFLFTGRSADFAQQQRFIEMNDGLYSLSGGALLFFITKQAIFGNYRPSSRRFLPGSHSFSSSQTINGREVRRLWCNKESNASLELDYPNIGEPIALEMLNLYNKSYGNYASVALPSSVFAGAGSPIEQYMNLSETKMRWYFAEPPKIRGVKPGICSVTLRFEGKVSTERTL